MEGIQEILSKMAEVTASPKKAVEDFKAATGKGAVGWIPPYAPEEIIHAAGFLPVGMWGGMVELNKVRAVLPSFACSIVQSIMELQLCGAYDVLDAVICPAPCDTLKTIGQKWSRKEVPMLQFVHPQNRKLPAAKVFLTKEYEFLKERLEKVLDVEITDAALEESIAIYNEHRAVMREFAALAGKHPELIDPRARHSVFKSGYFMRKEEHTKLVKALNSELANAPIVPWDGVKVVISGIMAEPDSILDVFKELNVAIVCDDLAQEGRQNRVDTPADGTPMERLAGWWQNLYGCSLAYEYEKSRVSMLVDMAKDNDADAVIVAMMKFCDPEEFDYPMIKKMMEKEDIPLLQVEIDQQMQSVEQFRTRLQSFVEMIQ